MADAPPERPLGPGAEFDLIRSLLDAARRGGAGRGGDLLRVGPGDDAAVLRVPEGMSLVLSTDLTVEGVHFRRTWIGWEAVGWRAAAAALSDLAAMAARPLGLLLSLALPAEGASGIGRSLAAGVGACLEASDALLLGGDVSRSPGPVVVDAVAVGGVVRPVERRGARPGDELWVTGRLGGAAAAVRAWERGEEPGPRARKAFERPLPRWREARWLAERLPVHAMIDLSDGLAGDAGHLAAASGVGVELEAASLPLHGEPSEGGEVDATLTAGTERADRARLAAEGGEDYELLLALAPGEVPEAVVGAFRASFDLPLTRVGSVGEGSGVGWVGPGADGGGEGGTASFRGGFDHFRDGLDSLRFGSDPFRDDGA